MESSNPKDFFFRERFGLVEPTNLRKMLMLKVVLCFVYLGLGALLSFGSTNFFPSPFHRDLGNSPSFKEMVLPCLIVAVFTLFYELCDVMGVGSAHLKAKNETGGVSLFHTDCSKRPKEYIVAVRAQLNQVEQFPFFLATLFSSSLFVNGYVAGSVGVVWVLMRMGYSVHYRSHPVVKEQNLFFYTLPAYFSIGALAGSVIVSCCRILMAEFL